MLGFFEDRKEYLNEETIVIKDLIGQEDMVVATGGGVVCGSNVVVVVVVVENVEYLIVPQSAILILIRDDFGDMTD